MNFNRNKPYKSFEANMGHFVYGFFMVAVVFAVVTAIVLLVQSARNEEREWQKFKAAHKCKVTAKVPSHAGYKDYTPAQDGWLCDDGITYFKDAE